MTNGVVGVGWGQGIGLLNRGTQQVSHLALNLNKKN